MSFPCFTNELVIDGNKAIMGKLASRVAKALLEGQKVTVVRCENMILNNDMLFNVRKFKDWLRKRQISKPTRSQKHFRSPAMVFWQAVRGGLKYKIAKGKAAIARLKVFNGVPQPQDHMKRVVATECVYQLNLKTIRKITKLGDLMTNFGWRGGDLLEKEEQARMADDSKYWAEKCKKEENDLKVLKQKDPKLLQELEKQGY